MFSFLKKEELVSVNSQTVFNELQSLLSTQNPQSEKEILKSFSFMKQTLGEVFYIDYSYTFEELINKIENFNKECEKFYDRVEELNKKKNEFIIKSKNNKKDKNFFKKMKEFNNDIELINKKYSSHKIISTILKDENVKNKIADFCNNISTIRFSEQKISKNDIKKFDFDFLCIINRMHQSPNSNTKKKSLLKIGKIFNTKEVKIEVIDEKK